MIILCLATKNVSFEYDWEESTGDESKSLAQAGRHRSNFESVSRRGDAHKSQQLLPRSLKESQ
jgi:hypothetical protein